MMKQSARGSPARRARLSVSVSVMPETAQGDEALVQIYSAAGATVWLGVRDLSGREVLDSRKVQITSAGRQEVVLDVSSLAAGTYLVIVGTESTAAVAMLTVQR